MTHVAPRCVWSSVRQYGTLEIDARSPKIEMGICKAMRGGFWETLAISKQNRSSVVDLGTAGVNAGSHLQGR